MNSISTIWTLLEAGAAERPAISAPAGVSLTYGALRTLVGDSVKSLRSRGIEPNDRVAFVLDNGPEAATTFLAVAAGATAAPLNPAYRADEYEFYLSDLRAKLLIVARGKDSPSVDVATRLGVPVARLVAHPQRGAGTFALEFSGDGEVSPAQGGFAEPDDIALVLHTSGTTSPPKIVPLSQRNVCASARNVRETLSLTPDDRNLSIMPLFHIHGLIASLLAPLSAGSEVC
jgi:acyl-CoA synthetase (AMP-forming)/AMP-acid ligase II